MDEPLLQREFTKIQILVHAIYSAVLLYAAMVHFQFPAARPLLKESGDLFFLVFLAAALSTFPAAFLIGGRGMGSDRLTEKVNTQDDREKGLSDALALVRSGGIVMAALGESCGIFGLVLYLMTGDTTRPWFFFGLSLFHYAATRMKLRAVRAKLADL